MPGHAVCLSYRRGLELLYEGQAAVALHVGCLCRPTSTGVLVENATEFGRPDLGTLLGSGGWPSRNQDQNTGTDLRRVRRHIQRKALRNIGVQRLQWIFQEERPPQTHLQVSSTCDCVGYGYSYFGFYVKLSVEICLKYSATNS